MSVGFPVAFSKNRNEESLEDNWSEFVVPPFINELEIKTQSKALVIVGGRGCGKTTLLRYFCHSSQFSSSRSELQANDLCHIGLYWRADTNFLNIFVGGEQDDQTWRAAFEHVLACELGKEVIRSLRSINCDQNRRSMFGGLQELDLSVLSAFDQDIGQSLDDLSSYLDKSRIKLGMWINNIHSFERPTFLPAESFLRTLIRLLQEQLCYLSNTTFAVFVDEYENLRTEQQMFINGLLKHGRSPLIYNIAMKRNGWATRKTIGSEALQDISDYRQIDLEELLLPHFSTFAAELLFFRLAEYEPRLVEKLPIVPENLRSIETVSERYDPNGDYQNEVVDAAEAMLPRVSERQAASEICSDPKLQERLFKRIQEALDARGEKYSAEDFYDEAFPEFSVISWALLNRPREKPSRLLQEFQELKEGKENRLSPKGTLVGNNLFGCVNAIYVDGRRDSLLFSGFSSLVLISRGNIRHLLELVHRIFVAYANKNPVSGELPVVDPRIQATAIRAASDSILATVHGHGPYGPNLHQLALCLGSIFRERHRGTRQSEPEINHFTISGGEMGEDLDAYIQEAVKWSVIFVSSETKMKASGAKDADYILNPIYAPYFQISFRKKRSIALSTVNLLNMFKGDQSVRDRLVRDLGKVELPEADLFGVYDGSAE